MSFERLMNVQFMSCVQGVLRIITVTIRFNVSVLTWWLALTFSYLALICIDSFNILITGIIARPMKARVSILYGVIYTLHIAWTIYCLDNFLKELMASYCDSISDTAFVQICNFGDAKIIYFLEKMIVFYCFPTSQPQFLGKINYCFLRVFS